MAAGGVAVMLGEIRQHRLEHARIGARRGVVVHVNRKLKHAAESRSAQANLCGCKCILQQETSISPQCSGPRQWDVVGASFRPALGRMAPPTPSDSGWRAILSAKTSKS